MAVTVPYKIEKSILCITSILHELMEHCHLELVKEGSCVHHRHGQKHQALILLRAGLPAAVV
jgi:hypothetical protein